MARRWGIVGAGAVGGYFGFRLAQAGEPVSFLVRAETLRALRARGLRLTSGGSTLEVRVEASGDPSILADRDTVLLAVKMPELPAALEAVRRGLGGAGFVVTLQNGVDAPRQALEALGPGRVVAGIAYLGAERTAPGEILHTGFGRITLGEPEGGASARCAELAADFEACGIPARPSARISEDLWKKLAWNAAFNGPTALARCAPADLVADAEGSELCRSLVREVIQAARSRGVELPGTLPEEVLQMSAPLGGLRTSMLQDLEAGRPTEVESLYLSTLSLLRSAGLAAPAHQAVAGLLAAAEATLKGTRPGGWPGSARPSRP